MKVSKLLSDVGTSASSQRSFITVASAFQSFTAFCGGNVVDDFCVSSSTTFHTEPPVRMTTGQILKRSDRTARLCGIEQGMVKSVWLTVPGTNKRIGPVINLDICSYNN